MLLNRYRQLLTAYVDGELSKRQRRAVDRLLRQSVEARQLLQQLQRDARTLRTLPRPALSEDLSVRIVRTIHERRLAPGRRRLANLSTNAAWFGSLAPYVAAATVLFLLGAASYLYFSVTWTPPTTTELAKSEKILPSSPPATDRAARTSPLEKDEPQTALKEPIKPKDQSNLPAVVETPTVVHNEGERSKPKDTDKPFVEPKEETTLTDRLEMFQLDRVPDTLPVVVKVADLKQETRRKSFLEELRRDTNFRIEVPCKHGTKAFERVRRAAPTIQLGLIVEKQAQERIKMKWHTNYVLYLENVTPEELIRFLQQLSDEDRKLAGGKALEEQIDRLVLTRMTEKQRKDLSSLLGIDPMPSPSSSKGPLGTDPSKPLSDQTARQLGLALAGQGTPRPEAGKKPVMPPERFALVLAYNPVRPAPGSEEIKRFLDSRKPARPGSLHVLLVLRGS